MYRKRFWLIFRKTVSSPIAVPSFGLLKKVKPPCAGRVTWARTTLNVTYSVLKMELYSALHDESLLRTTDVEVIYPNRQNDYVSAFTYEELLKLDIGSWFKDANPEQWRESFRGLEIITVQDVIKIAEGYRFKRWGKDTNGVLDGHRYGERMYDKIQLPDGKVKYDFKYVEDEADNGNRPVSTWKPNHRHSSVE